jgi:ubiquinone/menaquinone biosynthesis C-methylase UbiE
MSKNQRTLINVGCGHQRPEGWINTDCSLNAMLQRLPLLGRVLPKLLKTKEYASHGVTYLNLTNRWHFANESVDVVYGSHVFEHLSMSGARHFLSEALRVLKPGGVIRLIVPDLETAARKYVAELDSGKKDASKDLLYVLNLHQENTYPPDKGFLYRMAHSLQGWPHQHKYMYDMDTLKKLMGEYGFQELCECSYAQSNLIAEIAQVENTAEGIAAIYVEGSKPS